MSHPTPQGCSLTRARGDAAPAREHHGSPVEIAGDLHTRNPHSVFPIIRAGVEIIPENVRYLSVMFGKRLGLPNTSDCDRCHQTSSHRRFAALSCKGVTKFWQDDVEDVYPARTPWLWCCWLHRQPARRRLRGRWSRGRNKISHAESAGADLGRYDAGRDGSFSGVPAVPQGPGRARHRQSHV